MNKICFALITVLLICLPAMRALAQDAVIPELNITQKTLPDTESMRFVQELKLGWNLGNTFDAHADKPWFKDELDYESSWCGIKTTEDMLSAIKEAGFGTIRIPVSWHNHVSGDDFKISERWLARVKEVVDASIKLDLKVILNIHHDTRPGVCYPSKEHIEISEIYIANIWRQLSEAFSEYDNRLVFEGMNEPRLAGTKYEWNLVANNAECNDAVECINRLNQLFVDTVRAAGGNNAERFLLVPGYCASLQGATHAGFRMPTDSAKDRLILSVHAYAPYNFALQAMNESGSTSVFSVKNNKGTADIDHLMRSLYNQFVSKGVPVLIGEFGSRAKGDNLQARVEHAAYYVAAARAHGITCCWWDNNAFAGSGELFGLFERAKLTWSHRDILDAMLSYAG